MNAVALKPTPPAAPPREGPRALDGADLAIVNEQIGEIGGTERVLVALIERYPGARLLAPRFGGANVAPADEPAWTSRVTEVGSAPRKRHHLAPVYARWLAAAPTGGASVVLSLAHSGWGAAAAVPPGARHVCYSAGLPRALYGHVADYLRPYSPPVRPLLRAALPALRAHDRRTIRRPDRLLTNSRCSAEALARVHGREADVVYPPVRSDFFTPEPRERRHFLAVARLCPQKRIDVLVDAFRELDERLVVAGGGPWLERLRARAPANVSFAGYVSDAELRELYRGSHATICPSVEEFGIVMGESLACATPVVAPRAGGALEIVTDGATGILVRRVDVADTIAAVRAVRRREFEPAGLRASAERFSAERFTSRIESVIAEERERALEAVRG